MNQQLQAIARRIQAELPEMERTIQRARRALERAQVSSDELYLDSVALNLHSFYGAVERLFTLVSPVVSSQSSRGQLV